MGDFNQLRITECVEEHWQWTALGGAIQDLDGVQDEVVEAKSGLSSG